MQALSIKEVAKAVGISEPALKRMLHDGVGPTVVKIGRRSVIFEEDLKNWVAKLPRRRPAGKVA